MAVLTCHVTGRFGQSLQFHSHATEIEGQDNGSPNAVRGTKDPHTDTQAQHTHAHTRTTHAYNIRAQHTHTHTQS